MNKLVPVSRKGQVVIPAALRKKHKIGRTVVMAEAGGKITIEPSRSMRRASRPTETPRSKSRRRPQGKEGARSSLNARSCVFDARKILR